MPECYITSMCVDRVNLQCGVRSYWLFYDASDRCWSLACTSFSTPDFVVYFDGHLTRTKAVEAAKLFLELGGHSG